MSFAYAYIKNKEAPYNFRKMYVRIIYYNKRNLSRVLQSLVCYDEMMTVFTKDTQNIEFFTLSCRYCIQQ